MKKSLASIQKNFFNAIREPLSAKDRLALKSHHRQWVDDSITSNNQLSSQERFEIYARQYWFRIMESLYDDFPGLRALMGDDLFEKTVRDYIQAYPSRSYTLRDFGFRLPEYIRRRRKKFGTKSLLYLQMIQLELAQIDVFDAPLTQMIDASSIGFHLLKRKFQIAPHVRFFEMDYPLDELQRSLNQDGVREQLSNGVLDRRLRSKYRSQVKRLKKEKVYLAVHRHDSRVYFKRLEPWSYRLLVKIGEGIPLGKSIEFILTQKALFKKDFPVKIQAQFQEWTALGWIRFLEKQKKKK